MQVPGARAGRRQPCSEATGRLLARFDAAARDPRSRATQFRRSLGRYLDGLAEAGHGEDELAGWVDEHAAAYGAAKPARILTRSARPLPRSLHAARANQPRPAGPSQNDRGPVPADG